MTYKSILVHVDSTDDMLVRAAKAVELALQFKAQIVGSIGGLLPPPVFGDASGVVLASIVEAERERLVAEFSQAGDRFLAACHTVVDVRCHVLISEPTTHLLRHAGASDLVVLTRPHETDRPEPTMGISVGHVIMAAGRPVLCVPPGAPQRDFRKVVVAWRNTREARRAVADALPFLKRADSVAIASIGESSDEMLDDVVLHLERHNVTARVVRRIGHDATVARTVLDIAEETGAGLVVAGAYGHSRLREWMFGGVTRELLHTSTLAVLFSH